MEEIYIKRIYEPYGQSDGYRILVDRLWPRGISKPDAKIDKWTKEFTPSTALRKKIHQNEIDWEQFDTDFRLELANNPAWNKWKASIAQRLQTGRITFVTAAKLLPKSHAEILKSILENK